MTIALINLLPHRDKKIYQRKRDFVLRLVLTLGLALVLATAIYCYFAWLKQQQQARLAFLEAEVVKLDTINQEINQLKEQINSLNLKIETFAELMKKRDLPQRIFNEIVSYDWTDIYIASFSYQNKNVEIIANALNQEIVNKIFTCLSNSQLFLISDEIVIKDGQDELFARKVPIKQLKVKAQLKLD